jgi:hypothetical protein
MMNVAPTMARKGNESTNSRLGESEDDEEVQTADEDSAEGEDDGDDEEVHTLDEDSEHIDGRNDESRVAALKSGESEVDLFASSTCDKAVNTNRKASCAPKDVEGKRRQAEHRSRTEGKSRKASRVKDDGSEMDQVAITEIPTSSVRAKTLETKRKASFAPTHTGDKRRKAETLNDTDSIPDNESRAGKDHGNASLVKDGSAGPKSSMESSGGKLPRFSVGTRFRKEFPGHGMFQGTIASSDGEHYRVYYPSDGDSEELSDYELDDVEMMETTTSRARASKKKIDR